MHLGDSRKEKTKNTATCYLTHSIPRTPSKPSSVVQVSNHLTHIFHTPLTNSHDNRVSNREGTWEAYGDQHIVVYHILVTLNQGYPLKLLLILTSSPYIKGFKTCFILFYFFPKLFIIYKVFNVHHPCEIYNNHHPCKVYNIHHPCDLYILA